MSTYYIDAINGSDANDGLAPGRAWQTVAKVRASSFNAGDLILFKRGCTWREQLTVPSSGSAGSPILFGDYGTGDLPKIYGSTQISTWSDEGGNIWYAMCAADPGSVWFFGSGGTITWGTKQATKGAVTSEYKWWFDAANTRLYVYAASDPDSRYASIEKPTREYCIFANGKNYILLSNLDCAFSQLTDADGMGAIHFTNCISPVVEDCRAHHTGYVVSNSGNGIYFENSNGATARRNTVSFCGRRGIVAFLNVAGKTVDNVLIERNTVYDCYHAGIDMFRNNVSGSFDGAIVRYNHVYNDADYGQGGTPTSTHGILAGGPTVSSSYRITNVKVYYNLIRNMMNDQGIELPRRANGVEIYNNTVYGSFTDSTTTVGIDVTGSVSNSNITIKNNIVMDMAYACLVVQEAANVIACDNNLWYQSAGGTKIYTRIAGTSYHYDDFAAYKTATGWDAAGLWENPKFLDAANGDLRPRAESLCIGAGANVGLTQDHIGNAIIGLPDIGAYEYQEEPVSIKTVPFTLAVTAAPDFFPAILPTSLSVAKGVVAVYTVSFTAQGGFTGPVTLAALNLPTGAVATFSKTSINVTETSTLSITTTTVALGTFSLTLEGTATV